MQLALVIYVPIIFIIIFCLSLTVLIAQHANPISPPYTIKLHMKRLTLNCCLAGCVDWDSEIALPHGLICPMCCSHVGQNQTGLVIMTLQEQKSDATLRAVVRWPRMGEGRVLHLASLVLTFGLRSPDETRAGVRERAMRAGFFFLCCRYWRFWYTSFNLTCPYWRTWSFLIFLCFQNVAVSAALTCLT